MSDLVSVIIPAYNAELYILKAVHSILQQTYKHLEVIITDDCSTDSTFQILQSINDGRVKLFRNEKNSGVSSTLNNCILKSSGDLIAVMHADDIALADRIKLQADFMRENKQIAIIGSQYESIDELDNVLKVYPVVNDTYELLLETLLKKIPFPHPSVMYRREVIFEVGLYKSVYDGLEDHDMWLRLVAAGYKLSNIPLSLLKYRSHTSQISQNFTKADYTKNFSIFYDFVQKLGVKRSYEEVVRYSKICMNSSNTSSPKEFSFFLHFFSDLVNSLEHVSASEKKLLKNKLGKRLFRSKSKKRISSYADFYLLLQWLFLNNVKANQW